MQVRRIEKKKKKHEWIILIIYIKKIKSLLAVHRV